MNQNLWIHLIADLYECDFSANINKISPEENKQKIIELVKKSWLTILESAFYVFENNSFSLNIMLSESHLCIHTWPEIEYVSLDLFVCNYTCDNSNIAQTLFDNICELFSSNNKKITKIQR